MRWQTPLRLVLVSLVLASPAVAQDSDAADSRDRSFAQSLSRAFNSVASEVAPSVVFIQRKDVRIVGAQRDLLTGRIVRPGREQLFDSGNGSGVVVSADGLILTNNHVIEDAEALEVQLTDGRVYDAQILGADPATDIAVLRIDASDLRPARLGNSDELRVGDWVLALGSPFGLSNTVTAGIVSAKGRDGVFARNRQASQRGGVQYEEFIQTDAAINPGNSGGPLVNLEGEVVGINTAIFSRTGGNIGLSFAVPTAIAERVMRSIVEDGRVARGWLGVTLEDLTRDDEAFMGVGRGVIVTSVLPDSPADLAGVREGDVILSADGRPAETSQQLINTIALTGPERAVELVVFRDGEENITMAVLGDRERYIRERLGIERIEPLGLSVIPLNDETRSMLDLPEGLEGLVVYELDGRGRGRTADLRLQDIIQRADGRGVQTPRDLERALRRLEDGDPVELFVLRGSRRGTLTVRP